MLETTPVKLVRGQNARGSPAPGAGEALESARVSRDRPFSPYEPSPPRLAEQGGVRSSMEGDTVAHALFSPARVDGLPARWSPGASMEVVQVRGDQCIKIDISQLKTDISQLGQGSCGAIYRLAFLGAGFSTVHLDTVSRAPECKYTVCISL